MVVDKPVLITDFNNFSDGIRAFEILTSKGVLLTLHCTMNSLNRLGKYIGNTQTPCKDIDNDVIPQPLGSLFTWRVINKGEKINFSLMNVFNFKSQVLL